MYRSRRALCIDYEVGSGVTVCAWKIAVMRCYKGAWSRSEEVKCCFHLLFSCWESLPAAASIWYKRCVHLQLLPFGTKGGFAENLHLRLREFTRRLNGLIGEMDEACADRIAFVRELLSVAGESVPTKTVVFLEEMMNKEGSREWQLADLVREGRERVREIEFFVGKLMRDARDWGSSIIYLLNQFWERAKLDDIRLARQINALCDTLTNVIDGRWSFVGELDMLAYKFVPGKMAEFMKEMHDKDIMNLMKLQILGREFELRAREKDLFIEKLKGNMTTKSVAKPILLCE
ncbi:hypothetical protein Tco_0502707 [Tanacetum coccineum]